jgi:Tfp pilus assembly protein PilN
VKPVNLLPEQHRGAEPGQGRGAHVLLGVLAALVALVGIYAVTANQVNSRKSDANEAKHQAEELSARAGSLESFGNFARVAQNRSASVRSLAEVRFDWERFMRELSLVVPRGSWLEQVNSSVTGDLSSTSGTGSSGASTSSTASSSPSAGQSSGQPVGELVGCSPRQTDVATLMVRLRRLYRVTDVTLNESSRESDSGTASVDSCGRYLKFDVTVTFGPVPASGEAPSGRKRVPARLGGGS